MTGRENGSCSNLNSNRRETNTSRELDMEQQLFQVDSLQEKLLEVKANMESSQPIVKKELEALWKRFKTASILLNYLKSKARIMAFPESAQASLGHHQLKGVELAARNGMPLSSWPRMTDVSFLDSTDEETWISLCKNHWNSDEQEEAYVGDLIKSVQVVCDVMDGLVKRVIIAESERETEKEKVSLGEEEIRNKAIQLECMSLKLEEMEQFTLGTNSVLNEMRQRVEDLVEETSRQRQRATENEQELCRVKQDFESLKSYVSRLISVRETLLSSEKQFQTIEKLFERLISKTTQLEKEKLQKDTEVRKLVQENDRLTVLLDKKEAQLLALNEQFKVMALSTADL